MKTRKDSGVAAQSQASGASPAQKTDPTNAAYYAAVESDLQTMLKEYPGLEAEAPLPLSALETDKSQTGVQELYNLEKGKKALALHDVYRCSLSLFSLKVVGSPTPGIPMSRRRVLDMSAFYYPDSAPAYMTGRQVEVWADRRALTDKLENLQMVSPEELVHSMIAACADAIRCLGCIICCQSARLWLMSCQRLADIKQHSDNDTKIVNTLMHDVVLRLGQRTPWTRSSGRPDETSGRVAC